MDNLNEILGKVTEFLKSEAKTETIVGQQFKLGEFTCVPVVSVGIGFGAGEGKGDEKSQAARNGSGVGGAAGVGIGPVGFLVANNHDIQFIPAHANKGLSAAFEKIPGLLEKLFEQKKNTQKS